MELLPSPALYDPDPPPDEEASGPNCTITSGCTTLEHIGYLYFYTPISLMGIVLNSLNMAVLTGTKFKLSGSTFTYLTALALADLMTCFLAWPIGIMRCVPYSHTWQHYVREVYEIYVYVPIANSFATASVWLTVAVSVERYFFVGKSLFAQTLCSKVYAKRVILFISVSSFLINLPYFFHRTVSDTDQPDYTDWSKSTGYQVYSWCRLFLVKLIPIITIAIFNGMLVLAVWKANRRRKSLVFPCTVQARRQRMQIRTTAMLITISVIFLLCHILEPFIHSGIYTSLFGPCSIYTDTYAFLRTFINTLEIFSYATNFIVYCLFNKQFTAALNKLCKCSTTVEDKTMFIPEGSTLNTRTLR